VVRPREAPAVGAGDAQPRATVSAPPTRRLHG
jgi:hypothetical protein